jgi:hypothetical protein
MDAQWEVVDRMSTDDWLVIKDVGDHSRCYTVTNDADNVVKRLISEGLLGLAQRLFYFDSGGDLDEIIHEKGKFKAFHLIGRTTRAALAKLI